jgi:hypothetical protein
MKYYLLTLLFVLSINFSLAQSNQALPYIFDIKKEVIYGALDNHYNPSDIISFINVDGLNYTKGVYYDLDGNRNSGYLKLNSSTQKMKFKKELDQKTISLGLKKINGYVIGDDSLLVIRGKDLERIWGDKIDVSLKLIQFVGSVDSISFFKYSSHGVLENGAMAYVLKNEKLNQKWKRDRIRESSYFSSANKKIMNMIKFYFPQFKHVYALIEKYNLKDSNLREIIELLKYEEAYIKGTKLNIDNLGFITDKKTNLYAKVDSVTNFKFHVSYFLDRIKCKESAFNLLYHKKEERIDKYFSSDGHVYKIVYHKDNIQKKIDYFYPNGQLQVKSRKVGMYWSVDSVFSIEGKSILNQKGDGQMSFIDPNSNREIFNEYKKNEVNSSYFLEGEEKVYLLANKQIRYKFFSKFYQKIINEFERRGGYKFMNNENGFALLQILINKDGTLNQVKTIESINKKMEGLLINILESTIDSKTFIPGNQNKKEVKQFFLFPVYFANHIPSSLHHSHWTDNMNSGFYTTPIGY